ncbi:hypothetical protein HDU87_006896 [Geranomyces variabilis]|uniref:Uncharacterized protein n=1 Tax=Geranomyces variabilis TaxID=109894 RepID=A0AAD5TF90_9FUNG|nr:hypothetical protein HDU87_006896 [Geranomyces variabilis]
MHSIVFAPSVTAGLIWTARLGPGLHRLTNILPGAIVRRPKNSHRLFSAVRPPPAGEQARIQAHITSARKELLQLQAACDRIRKDLEAAQSPAPPRLWKRNWAVVTTTAHRVAAATKTGVSRFRASTSRLLAVLSEAVAPDAKQVDQVSPDSEQGVQVLQASHEELEAEVEVTDQKTALEAPVDTAIIMLSADKIVPRIIHAIAKAGIQPYTITPFHIYTLDDVAKTTKFLKVIQAASGAPPYNKIRVVGLDCETASRGRVLGGPPSLIQIAFAENLIAIFHV